MAGSWEGPVYHRNILDKTRKPVTGADYEFTSDATDGSIPIKETVPISGALANLLVVFDGTTPPNTLTVKIEDSLGGEIMAETVFTATGYANPDVIRVFLPGLLTITCTGNTTNSAKAKVIPIII